jgi:hypothetical protein
METCFELVVEAAGHRAREPETSQREASRVNAARGSAWLIPTLEL